MASHARKGEDESGFHEVNQSNFAATLHRPYAGEGPVVAIDYQGLSERRDKLSNQRGNEFVRGICRDPLPGQKFNNNRRAGAQRRKDYLFEQRPGPPREQGGDASNEVLTRNNCRIAAEGVVNGMPKIVNGMEE